ncbi:Usher syndrome type-1G protein homolog [Daphnia pulicaria]|uniref:Usher syndrome type-1G protein homolog n=1 Tax=Daphnia pulicaria TaxID=35523 RepID=UPI001EEB88EA|nr:Usher syndrome type-1G protein homolog [Daphnia pulicaria]
MAHRFHRAARDGKLDILKEATRKDCNSKDDDGMTPTLWATFEGHLEALRLIIGRGGDPEKCDHYGNTALHFAAARGHMNCVTFLMGYGVNLYAKDIDYHTAKELAAMNDRQEILRYLDEQDARQQRHDAKKVKAQTEKATKETDKLVKEFAQVQEKARKLAEKEKKRLEKEREEMERSGMNEAHSIEPGTLIPRPSMAAIDLRRDSRLIYSPKYSDIVNPKEEKDKIKLPVSAVYKKVQQQRRKMMSSSSSNQSSVSKSATANNNNGEQVTTEPGDFKIGAVEDGKRSVRSISGLRRDSEIMYMPKYDDSNGKRTGLDSVFPNPDSNSRSKSISSGSSNLHPAGYPKTSDSGFSDDLAFQPHRSSIFELPGFGRLAFRNSITALGGNSMNLGVAAVPPNKEGESTVDDATRLNHNRRQREDKWDQDDLESSDDEEENGQTPMYFFLAAFGLEEFIEPLVREKFDLDSLMLVSEEDLISMKIPLGHRRKLMKAINDRKAAIENPDEMEDSHL